MLLPFPIDDWLRALGYVLDQSRLRLAYLREEDTVVVLRGEASPYAIGKTAEEWRLSSSALTRLVEEAHQRRGRSGRTVPDFDSCQEQLRSIGRALQFRYPKNLSIREEAPGLRVTCATSTEGPTSELYDLSYLRELSERGLHRRDTPAAGGRP